MRLLRQSLNALVADIKLSQVRTKSEPFNLESLYWQGLLEMVIYIYMYVLLAQLQIRTHVLKWQGIFYYQLTVRFEKHKAQGL